MSKDEFFAFMPLLIYGIAVSELVMHWRDYLKSDRRYWAHLVTGIILLELAFVNFYYLYDVLDQLFIDYHHFLLRLSSPLIFLLMVSVYTPESSKNVKEYFLDKTPTIFTLLAIFIAINIVNDFGFNPLNYIRIIAISLCLIIAYTKKVWLIWGFIILRTIAFISDIYFPSFINS